MKVWIYHGNKNGSFMSEIYLQDFVVSFDSQMFDIIITKMMYKTLSCWIDHL